jgi:voltage-gated potassium channel
MDGFCFTPVVVLGDNGMNGAVDKQTGMPRAVFISKAGIIKFLDLFIVVLILFNIGAIILETEKSVYNAYRGIFIAFEYFSIAVFTIEYLLRLWFCTHDERFKGAFRGRLRFAMTPLALIDLCAILPFYLPMLLPIDLRFIRAIRLFRLFRIFKLARYSTAFTTLTNVIRAKKEELLITAFIVGVLLVTASSLMYFIENEAQPKAFSSIPAAMWWGIATLSTVGYGDIYPVTLAGKVLGAVIALLGIGMFALPAGILGSGFVEELHRQRPEKKICPHCGKELS